MIHLVIDRDGSRTEYSEDDARWLATRSTIVRCDVPHFSNYDKHEFYNTYDEYTIYHPGTRNGRMISITDVNARLAERGPVTMCMRCGKPLENGCECGPRLQ